MDADEHIIKYLKTTIVVGEVYIIKIIIYHNYTH